MARSRGLGLRPVNSIKHVVDSASSAVAATKSNVTVIEAKDSVNDAIPIEVLQGCTVKWIYLKVEAYTAANPTLRSNFYFAVFKNPGNAVTNPAANAIGESNLRKHVIHQEMIMLGNVDAAAVFPRTVFNGVIKIPPRLRRFGIDDRLYIILQNGVGETTQESRFCIQCIYKEYR